MIEYGKYPGDDCTLADFEVRPMKQFVCPRCGGRAFGLDLGTGRYECHNDVNGQPQSARFDEQLRVVPGTTNVACGWREETPSGTLLLRVHFVASADGGYTAYVPVMPGCVSEGDTLDEARANIREAIDLWRDEAIDTAPHKIVIEDVIEPRPEVDVLSAECSLLQSKRSDRTPIAGTTMWSCGPNG